VLVAHANIKRPILPAHPDESEDTLRGCAFFCPQGQLVALQKTLYPPENFQVVWHTRFHVWDRLHILSDA